MKQQPAIAADSVPALFATNYPAPFAERVVGRGKRALGDIFGISNFGVNLITLPPGAQSSVRHRHTVQEEFVYILEGELILVHDDGEIVCLPGMCAGFVPGGTAHHFINRSDSLAAFLVVGDRRQGDCGIYPDDDLQAVHHDGVWHFTHKDGRPYA